MNSKFNRIKTIIFLVFFIPLLSITTGYAMDIKNEQKDSIFVTFDGSVGSKFIKIMDLFLNTTSTPASSANTYIVKPLFIAKYSEYLALYSSLSYIQAIDGKPVVHTNLPVNYYILEKKKKYFHNSPDKPWPQDTGELIIRLKPAYDMTIIMDILALIYEFKVVSGIDKLNAYLIKIPEGMDSGHFAMLLKLSPYIADVEVNKPVKAF